MALELYHSPYRLTMYYQGLLSLIAPSQMMICGTMTLRYLFRIVLSGAVTKDTHFITSGLVTRQGGIGGSSFVYPLSLSKVLTVAFSLNSNVWGYNWYTQDSKVNIRNTAVSNPKGFPYNWLVIGIV